MPAISLSYCIAVSAFIVIFCYSSYFQSNENQSVVPEAMLPLYLKIVNPISFTYDYLSTTT